MRINNQFAWLRFFAALINVGIDRSLFGRFQSWYSLFAQTTQIDLDNYHDDAMA